MTTSTNPDIAPPPGFTADSWVPGDRGDLRAFRLVRRERAIAGEKACVETRAIQYADCGLVEIELFVHMTVDEGLGSGEARQLARLLMAAADEMDRWVQS